MQNCEGGYLNVRPIPKFQGPKYRADSWAPSIRVARTRKRLPQPPPPTESVIYAALGLPPPGDPLDFPDTPQSPPTPPPLGWYWRRPAVHEATQPALAGNAVQFPDTPQSPPTPPPLGWYWRRPAVHEATQPALAGNAVMEFRELPQKMQVMPKGLSLNKPPRGSRRQEACAHCQTLNQPWLSGSATNLVASADFTRISTVCLPSLRSSLSVLRTSTGLETALPLTSRIMSPVWKPCSAAGPFGSTPVTTTPLPAAPATSVAGARVRPRRGTPVLSFSSDWACA